MSTPSLSTRTAPCDIDDAHTLIDEHARLVRDVERRAAPVQALLDARAWPHAELAALTALLRSVVLRQVADEEVHLFPNDASAPPFAELSTDHLRLRRLIAELEKAYARPCSHNELRDLVNDLLHTLRRHVEDEQKMLAALAAVEGEVPAVARLAAVGHTLLSDDSPVRIELDTVHHDQAIELCIERLLRLVPGQIAEVRASDRLLLLAVSRWLREFDRGRFGLDDMTSGQGYLLRVTCRHSTGSGQRWLT